jgi:two-component system chemotaxis family response regulator WspR
MIDVDDFKRYNDTYGHLAGDEVLQNVSRVIKASVARPGDIAARFGGEEFVVVLPNSSHASPRTFGEKLCESVERLAIPHRTAAASGVVTVSIGGAFSAPQLGDLLTDLIAAADAALYQAKRSGKNRVVIAG